MRVLKTLTTCVVLSSSLFAQSVSEIDMQKYNGAVDAYNANKFDVCYNEFYELFMVKSDDSRINFYLGRCATELKMYDEAQLAFERVLLLDPTHIRSKLELGRLYFEQKQFDEAQVQFDAVLESNAPEDIKTQVRQLSATIDAGRQKHSVSGAVILGLELNSNIRSDGLPYIPDQLKAYGLNPSSETPVMDYSPSELIALTHKYKIGRTPYSWQNNLVMLNQSARQRVSNNMLYSQLGTAMAYGSDSIDASIGPSFERLKYGFGLPDMMWSKGASQKFSYRLGDKVTSIDESASIKSQKFYKDLKFLNATGYDVSVGIKRQIDDKGRSVGADYAISSALYEQAPGKDSNVKHYSQKIGVSYNTPADILGDLAVTFSLKKDGYADDSQMDFKRRKDLEYIYSATLTKAFSPTSIFTFDLSRALSRSTLEKNTYQRTTFKISYIYPISFGF